MFYSSLGERTIYVIVVTAVVVVMVNVDVVHRRAPLLSVVAVVVQSCEIPVWATLIMMRCISSRGCAHNRDC